MPNLEKEKQTKRYGVEKRFLAEGMIPFKKTKTTNSQVLPNQLEKITDKEKQGKTSVLATHKKARVVVGS